MQQGGRPGGGHVPPHLFGGSVTPFSTRGGDIIPTQYYVPPQILDPCYMPELYI